MPALYAKAACSTHKVSPPSDPYSFRYTIFAHCISSFRCTRYSKTSFRLDCSMQHYVSPEGKNHESEKQPLKIIPCRHVGALDGPNNVAQLRLTTLSSVSRIFIPTGTANLLLPVVHGIVSRAAQYRHTDYGNTVQVQREAAIVCCVALSRRNRNLPCSKSPSPLMHFRSPTS